MCANFTLTDWAAVDFIPVYPEATTHYAPLANIWMGHRCLSIIINQIIHQRCWILFPLTNVQSGPCKVKKNESQIQKCKWTFSSSIAISHPGVLEHLSMKFCLFGMWLFLHTAEVSRGFHGNQATLPQAFFHLERKNACHLHSIILQVKLSPRHSDDNEIK